MLSVIVPVYNAERFLTRCVESVTSQSYRDIELLLVDDGSTDGSLRLCNALAAADARIKVLHQANAGVSAARNAALNVATGRFVMMLDSDDRLAPDCCERLLAFQRECGADCVVFGIRQDNGNVWAPSRNADYSSFEAFMADFSFWLNTELLSPVWNKLYKRSLIADRFPQGVSFGEDLVFSLAYLRHCSRISFITDTCYLHNNLNEASIVHNFRMARIRDIEYWQAAVLQFADHPSDPALYRKYLSDVLFYLKGLYGRSDLHYSDICRVLQAWYPASRLSRMQRPSVQGAVNRFLLACLRHRLWRLPYVLLKLKRIFIRH